MKQSRQFTIVDVPDPVDIRAEFVYNFFTPDERINGEGDLRVPGATTINQTQRLIKAGTLKSEVPRYNDVNFKPAQIIEMGNLGDAKNNLKLIDFDLDDVSSEESITNDAFAAFRESDPDASARISDKIKSLSAVLEIDFSASDQTKTIANLLGVKRGMIQSLITPYLNAKDLKVNFRPKQSTATMFDTAAQLSLNSLVNKRVLDITVQGADDVSPLSKFEIQKKAQLIADNFKPRANSSVLTEADLEPTFIPMPDTSPEPELNLTPQIVGAQTVGYLLIRKQLAPSGRMVSTRVFPIEGRDNIRYLDSQVVYGSKYFYSVRTVYRVDAVVASREPFEEGRNYRIATLIASRPSKSVAVLTEEFEPPDSPNGVFHKFNYNRGRGLIITWQFPSGRSRDTKFFQVFKRFSIYEPFQCIGEIDFDDSVVRTLRPETIRQDLIIKKVGGWTMFEDKKFNRDSRPAIYAVCAVDAHGLSSGYSSQTQVGFDKMRNRLTLKNISRPGAPKQYPNFFVDPDLDDNIAVDSFSQDAIFDSGHTRMDVYFTPDALEARTSSGRDDDVLVTDRNQGIYKMHVLNLDLQKSTVAEIKVNDNRQFTKT